MSAHLAGPVGPDDHIRGPADAKLTVVEYGDYQCPYCGQAYSIVEKLLNYLRVVDATRVSQPTFG